MSELVSIASSTALVVLLAILLRNLLGGSPAPVDAGEAAIRDLAAVLQSRDLTVPRTQDIAVMILELPDYPTLVRERPLEQVFTAVNLFYRVSTEIADRHKGEVSSLVGGEITILFGRILPVEKPLHTAVNAALEIVERTAGDLAPVCPGCRGAAAAIGFGPALSGPVGGEWRRTYASVGVTVDDAHRLARALPPGEVRAPAKLADLLRDYELDLTDPATVRIVKPTAPPSPPQA